MNRSRSSTWLRRAQRLVASDEAAAIPVLEALSQAGLQPSEMAADTTYGSAANAQAYEDRGTELVSPVRGPEAQPLAEGQKSVADFKLDGDGEGPVVCPAGYEAPEVLRSATGRVHARYSAEQCGNCPLRCGCPTRQNEDGTRSFRTDRKAYLLEKRRRYELTAEFRKRYAPRAGIEGSNSELKRAHGLGKLRVRREGRVRLSVYLKVLACNVKRMIRYLAQEARKAVEVAKKTGQGGLSTTGGAILATFRLDCWPGRPPILCIEEENRQVQHEGARVRLSLAA